MKDRDQEMENYWYLLQSLFDCQCYTKGIFEVYWTSIASFLLTQQYNFDEYRKENDSVPASSYSISVWSTESQQK